MSEQYTDVFGNHHTCLKAISRGGQGVVYRTQTPNLVVKLACEDQLPIKDAERMERVNREYDTIRLLPIPQGLHITLPLATLDGAAGYVMTLLDGMDSFETVFWEAEAPEAFTTPWLDEIRGAPIAEQLGRYIASGSRRRRLEAFYHCACILAQIHGAGLVYCDISRNNLFVSSDMDAHEVWLIDADNLNWAKERTAMPGFFTPGYGAPEVVNGRGNSSYSDCYSFAVALFWTLYETHPFEGCGVMDEDGDFSEELRDGGSLPWIFDDEDDENAADGALPCEYYISPPLRALFQQTFSALGRSRPASRPAMPEWVWALGNELDRAVRCPHCGMDYNAYEFSRCPWCDTRPPLIRLRSFRAEGAAPFWSFSRELEGDGMVPAPLRLIRGARAGDASETLFSVCRFSPGDTRLKLSGFRGGLRFFLAETGKPLYGEVLVPGQCRLRCVHGDEEFWIEVRYEAE